jgi:hypothetical protein
MFNYFDYHYITQFGICPYVVLQCSICHKPVNVELASLLTAEEILKSDPSHTECFKDDNWDIKGMGRRDFLVYLKNEAVSRLTKKRA